MCGDNLLVGWNDLLGGFITVFVGYKTNIQRNCYA